MSIGIAQFPDAPYQSEPKTRARPMGLRTGIDPARLNQLADDAEVAAFLALNRKLENEKSARTPKRK